MPTVRVPHQFFIDERKKLYNWKPDFWRELLQNSLDAGSTEISVRITETGGGQTRVSFGDNGCGMTLDVLDEVYFALGATTKVGGDTVGGFGRARIMTCFGHDRYEIDTLGYQVLGTGAEYEILSLHEDDYTNGTEIRVWMSDTSASQMKQILTDYLRTCSLNVKVEIDGEQFTDWIPKGRKVRELSFGDVRVMATDPVKPYCVLFQVRGMTMFSKYVNCPKQIIVDINPNRAREVLSANRNGLTDQVSNEVDRWLAEISVDQRTALKDRSRYGRSLRMGNMGFRRTRRRKVDTPAATADINGKASLGTGDRDAALTRGHESDITDMPGLKMPVAGQRFVRNLHNVLIINETGDRSMDAVIDRYHPDNWTVEFKTTRGVTETYNKGREAYRLLIAYTVAVEEALNVLIDSYNLNDMDWSVGWCFGDFDGMHTEVQNAHLFCLNPVEGKKQRYKLSNKADLLRLIAIAKHEVAHAYRDVHDEVYANVLTEIDALLDGSKVLRRIKDELKSLDV